MQLSSSLLWTSAGRGVWHGTIMMQIFPKSLKCGKTTWTRPQDQEPVEVLELEEAPRSRTT